ncbi:rhodanese-like domain-containing protein [Acinetobacter sp. MB5]|uniref:rhodanese-like domain-containing protein n=1 Tax=Acinetobacter sp. MB5 TaxID=2069438 RepID=UPI000DD06BED|nr:rhodanese-like domain-containing protein [Acinetobacter sp. MB5]
MSLKKSSKELVEEAQKKIVSLTFEQAKILLNNANTIFVDIREIHEINQFGTIPNALHVPRGILEFVVDPESPYFNPILGKNKKIILFCRSSWRSALAALTLQEMGIQDIAHLVGGFDAWIESGGEVVVK